ncbi:DMT family transporter [Methylocapsa sp. S129]|uniref:DMT family transporter n=1 Tax=Methylocapsa sp. S129 TaxID=1641869 RepID=UPI00131B8065|nr:DMT family transporter [Methylocapsa sp. S129]
MPNTAASPDTIQRSHRAAKGRLLLIVSAIAFSTAGFFARKAPVDLWAMTFWRNLFGCAALLPVILAAKGGASWRSVLRLGRWGWAAIAASSFATLCFLAAFAHTSVANVSIIYATAPLTTALIAWLWLGEKATLTTLCAAALALFGVVLTVAGSLDGGKLLGDGLALMMAISLSLMTVIARRHGRLPALPTAFIASLVAALAVLPLGWASGASFVISWQATAWLAGFGVVTMALALPCYLSGAARVAAGQAMLISALEMPLAPFWVWLAFAEVPSRASLIGGAIVALAIVWQLGGES